jgi:hypothetical protein
MTGSAVPPSRAMNPLYGAWLLTPVASAWHLAVMTVLCASGANIYQTTNKVRVELKEISLSRFTVC